MLWDRETDTLRQIPFPEVTPSKEGQAGGTSYGLSLLGGSNASPGLSGSSAGTSAPSASSGLAEFFLTQKKKLKDDTKTWGILHMSSRF